ncbi:MAG: FAD-binding protein, partial [Chloroflexi bacterium]|nr:FAD-binding protein [Chloroflexota bacterium]
MQRAAEKHGFFYPPDPASVYQCTVGGNVATNAGGMQAIKYGVTRNNVLGLSLVLASGEIMQTGGKLLKISSGLDLTQLVIGSEGTLAITTEIILRLRPR